MKKQGPATARTPDLVEYRHLLYLQARRKQPGRCLEKRSEKKSASDSTDFVELVVIKKKSLYSSLITLAYRKRNYITVF